MGGQWLRDVQHAVATKRSPNQEPKPCFTRFRNSCACRRLRFSGDDSKSMISEIQNEPQPMSSNCPTMAHVALTSRAILRKRPPRLLLQSSSRQRQKTLEHMAGFAAFGDRIARRHLHSDRFQWGHDRNCRIASTPGLQSHKLNAVLRISLGQNGLPCFFFVLSSLFAVTTDAMINATNEPTTLPSIRLEPAFLADV